VIHKWLPDNPRITFRFDDGSEAPPQVEAMLVSFEVTAPDAGGNPEAIRVAFDCTAAVYARIEEQSWFHLHPGRAADLGMSFDPALLIRIEAAMDKITLETSFLPGFSSENARDVLAEIAAPFIDMDAFGPARSPVAYDYLRVSQTLPDKTVIAFTPEDAARPRAPAEAVITSISFGPTIPVLSAEPGTEAHFAGQVDVAGTLVRIRAEEGDNGPRLFSITVSFDGPNVASIIEHGFFGCPLISDAAPTEAVLDLSANLLELCFKNAGSDMEAMLTAAVESLADPEIASMYGSVASWVWRVD
jgi:hypothetical protein